MGRLGLMCHQTMPCVLGTVLLFTGVEVGVGGWGGTGTREVLWELRGAPASSSPVWREGLPRGQTGGMGMGQVLGGLWAAGGK